MVPRVHRRLDLRRGPEKYKVTHMDPMVRVNRSTPLKLAAGALGLAVVFVAGTGPNISASHPYDRPVWPGLPILIGAGTGCTLGFFFDSVEDDTVYGTTAGHCADRETNLTVMNRNRHVIGRVVEYRFQDGQDWALIRFHPDVVPRVRPDVVHWTGPSAPLNGADVETEDVVCHYGGSIYHGLFMGARCGRHAFFYRYAAGGSAMDWFMMSAQSWGGDSGSPVVHYETGQAVGMILGGSPLYGLDTGMTTCGIVNAAALAGYDLRLASAPYAPPDAAPSVPGPATVAHLALGQDASGDCT